MTNSLILLILVLVTAIVMLSGMKIKYVVNSKLPKLVAEVIPTIKLPVWPVYGGVIAQLFDILQLKHLSDKVMDTIGGRVVPMTLNSNSLSPFLLLAHHCHSFTPNDPMRLITNLLLPEGFPAHPHSGFSTVTYCIDGGLNHRDSEGIKMSYGDGDVQWMRAGKGVIHEEMWKTSESRFQKN